MHICLGRSERSASISEDVITTAVCPRYYILQIKAKNNFPSSRSRPEGKRISPPPGLQPPPSLPPRKMGDRQTAQVPFSTSKHNSFHHRPFLHGRSLARISHAPLQDLISFASPAPAAKTARPSLSSDLESLTITNNNNGGI